MNGQVLCHRKQTAVKCCVVVLAQGNSVSYRGDPVFVSIRNDMRSVQQVGYSEAANRALIVVGLHDVPTEHRLMNPLPRSPDSPPTFVLWSGANPDWQVGGAEVKFKDLIPIQVSVQINREYSLVCVITNGSENNQGHACFEGG